MILGILAAFAMGSGGAAALHQDIDPVAAAAKLAEVLNVPKEVGNGVWIRDSHAEGPLVVIGFEAPPGTTDTDWVADFVSGMCAAEYKAAMDRLFGAGMRVRPEVITSGKRTPGTDIDHCPA